MCATDTSSKTYLNALYTALAAVPPGRVITYGELAALAGRPGAARWVGAVLRQLPADTQLPWHRVIGAGGKLSLPPGSPGHTEQCRRLSAEGIDGRQRISLARYCWPSV